MLACSMLGRVFFLCFRFTFVLCPCSELAVSLYEIDEAARLVKKKKTLRKKIFVHRITQLPILAGSREETDGRSYDRESEENEEC